MVIIYEKMLVEIDTGIFFSAVIEYSPICKLIMTMMDITVKDSLKLRPVIIIDACFRNGCCAV